MKKGGQNHLPNVDAIMHVRFRQFSNFSSFSNIFAHSIRPSLPTFVHFARIFTTLQPNYWINHTCLTIMTIATPHSRLPTRNLRHCKYKRLNRITINPPIFSIIILSLTQTINSVSFCDNRFRI